MTTVAGPMSSWAGFQVCVSPVFDRLSSFEIDEQRDSGHDQDEGDDPPGDKGDFDEGRGSLLAICGDLL